MLPKTYNDFFNMLPWYVLDMKVRQDLELILMRCNYLQKNIKVIFKVSNFLESSIWHLLCQCDTHIETSQLICMENQLIGLYINVALAWYGLNQVWSSSSFKCLSQMRQTSMMEIFYENIYRLLALNYFHKKAPS